MDSMGFCFTGKDAKTHNIFRLGDYSIKNKQIFRILEENNFKVGAITPMNVNTTVLKTTHVFQTHGQTHLQMAIEFDTIMT